MRWDPKQYRTFATERARPFTDLLARIEAEQPRRVADLGCGPGTLTHLLAARWPDARVEGVDSSAEMIAAAVPTDRVSFAVADALDWDPSGVDVIVSNAMLQWVPAHRELLTRWAAALPPGGWLAFQVPGNFDAFSHTVIRSLAGTPRWAGSLAGVLRADEVVATPEEYAGLLLRAGLAADVWETTYVHVLDGDDPVLEWVLGTALRPIVAALPPAAYRQFEDELRERLRAAYPRTEHGTLFPFRRIFAVAHRPAAL